MSADVPDATAGPPPDPAARSRTLRLLVALAAIVAVVAGMRAFSGTLGPAFLALVLVIVVHPLQARLQRARVPTWIAVAANLVVVYLILLGLAGSLAWAVVELATALPGYAPQFLALRDSALDLLAGWGVDQSQVTQAVSSIDPNQVISLAQTLASGLTAGLTDFGFILLLVFFLALDAAVFPTLLAQAAWSHPDAVEAMTTFAAGTRRFLVVSTVFGAIVAVLDVVVLYWIGVPLALLWGLVAFVTNYVANIGFLLGVVPPALLALLANGPGDALAVVIAYTVINVVVQGMIQPKIVGGAVGLSATLTFLSVVFWGFALGGLGALLAVPLSLLARAVLVDADPGLRWMLPLISGSPRGVPRRPPVLGHLRSRAHGKTGATVAPAELSTARFVPPPAGTDQPPARPGDGSEPSAPPGPSGASAPADDAGRGGRLAGLVAPLRRWRPQRR